MDSNSNVPKANFLQVLCAFTEGAGALCMAPLLGFTSPAFVLMNKDPSFRITDEQGSWIGAIVPGMALVGSFLAGTFFGNFGRRYLAILVSLPLIFAWILVAMATSASQVILGRLVGGLCLGAHQVLISMFAAETVLPKLRPKFSVIPGLAYMIGFLCINISSGYVGWRGMAWGGAASCLPLLTLLLVLPETPYYLLKSGYKTECLKTLKRIRYSEQEAEDEFKEMQETLANESNKESLNVSDMIKAPYRWPFTIAIMLHIFQQASGISGIFAFLDTVIERLDSPIHPSTYSTVLTVMNIGAVFLSGRLLSTSSFKVIIGYSSKMIVFSLLVFSTYLWALETDGFMKDVSKSLPYIPLICLVIYTFGFGLGWGPIPWLFMGTGLPANIRGMGAGIIVATNWFFAFLTTKTFIWMSKEYGTHNLFICYATSTFVGMMVVNSFLPDTFGLTDAQLEKYYRDSYKSKRH